MGKLQRRLLNGFIFKSVCFISIVISITLLLSLSISIISKSYTAFLQPEIKLDFDFTNLNKLSDSEINSALQRSLLNKIHKQTNNSEFKFPNLISLDAIYYIKDNYKQTLGSKDVWIPASSLVGTFLKNSSYISNKNLINILNDLKNDSSIRLKFSLNILIKSDSREPESAGILGGFIGSFLTILICILLAIPFGVLCAVYLEEYASDNWLKSLIEININNLAAVPSIVYGLIGLSIYINNFNLPRSSSLVGGLTLALLTFPTIIVTTRQSLRAIPNYIRQGLLALGASPMQVTMHHIIPLATPGIVTGAILSISRALGETAPLIMLGMVAFITDLPSDFLDPATTMPVLIYTWADSPEYAFVEKTSAAILFLLFFIINLNYFAISLRNKYEHKW